VPQPGDVSVGCWWPSGPTSPRGTVGTIPLSIRPRGTLPGPTEGKLVQVLDQHERRPLWCRHWVLGRTAYAAAVPLADPELSEKMRVTHPRSIPSLDVQSAADVGCRSFVTAEIAGRQAHAAHRHFERALAGLVERAELAKLVRGDVGTVEAAVLLDVAPPRLGRGSELS